MDAWCPRAQGLANATDVALTMAFLDHAGYAIDYTDQDFFRLGLCPDDLGMTVERWVWGLTYAQVSRVLKLALDHRQVGIDDRISTDPSFI